MRLLVDMMYTLLICLASCLATLVTINIAIKLFNKVVRCLNNYMRKKLDSVKL
jgi:hypothetical protein